MKPGTRFLDLKHKALFVPLVGRTSLISSTHNERIIYLTHRTLSYQLLNDQIFDCNRKLAFSVFSNKQMIHYHKEPIPTNFFQRRPAQSECFIDEFQLCDKQFLANFSD